MLCATCLTVHHGIDDSAVSCDLYAPTSMKAFHASKLTGIERRYLHVNWSLSSWIFGPTT